MRRFIADASDISENSIVIRDSSEVNHIKNVLRLSVGEKVIITDSVKYEYLAEIDLISPDEIVFNVLNKEETQSESNHEITLFQCVPKQGKLELIIQKAVELGVYEIVPVYSERSVVKQGEKDIKKRERWQKIAYEAVKQCKRTIIPDVKKAIKLEEIPEILNSFNMVLMPYENENGTTIKGLLKKMEVPSIEENISDTKKIAVLIGPEGGFSRNEVELLTAAGAKTCSLGNTILRTETAAIAAISMIMYELELD